jgi:hypothetical protein
MVAFKDAVVSYLFYLNKVFVIEVTACKSWFTVANFKLMYILMVVSWFLCHKFVPDNLLFHQVLFMFEFQSRWIPNVTLEHDCPNAVTQSDSVFKCGILEWPYSPPIKEHS